MTLLDPISGLIAAAIAVPLLLLIYFLKLRRRPLRVSSTLLWEQAVKDLQVNVPLRWLRVSAVLVLQLLALAALVLALSRPAIPSEAPAADRTVIVIDNSASMSARDGVAESGTQGVAITRLDEAKRRAIELVRSLSRGTTSTGERPAVTVISSSAGARVVQTATTVTSDLIDAINAVEPTDHPGGIEAALELLEAARAATTAAEDDRGVKEEVVAFTDSGAEEAGIARSRRVIVGQRPGATGGVTTRDAARDNTRPTENTGIVALSVRRDAEQPDTVRIFARLVTTSVAPQSVPVRILCDDRLVGVRRVEFPGRTPGRAGGGEATMSFDFPRRDAGLVVVVIDTPDLLDSDNAVGATIGPVTTPSILVVAPAASGPSGVFADPFLMGFFESLHTRALRLIDAAAFGAEMAAARGEQGAAFRTFNLIVFDRVTPEESSVPAQPSISFGAGLPVPGLSLGELPHSTRTDGRTIRFDSWRRGHPLMRYVALEPIVISPAPAPIDTNGGATTSNAEGTGGVTVLASGPDGPLIAALEEPGGGTGAGGGGGGGPRRIVVSFPLLRSNWGPDTSFAVFMANAVDLLTGRGEAAVGRWLAAGRPMTVKAAAGARQVQASGPQTLSTEVSSATDRTESRLVSLGVPDRVGVYRLSGAAEGGAEVVCVNLADEGESLLGAGKNARGTGGDAATTAVDDRRAGAAERATRPEGRKEIWHWFILAAMALAGVEWMVFAVGIRG